MTAPSGILLLFCSPLTEYLRFSALQLILRARR